MRNKKPVFLLLIVVVSTMLIISFSGCKAETTLVDKPAAEEEKEVVAEVTTFDFKLVEEGYLTLGVAEDPPGSMWVSENELDGIGGDIWTEIAKRLGLKIKAVEVSWEGIVPSVATNKVDTCAVVMWGNAERFKSVDFTIPHGYEMRVIQQLKTNNYNSVEDLIGKKVASVVGNAEVPLYEEAGATINLFDTPVLALMDVLKENSDAAIMGAIGFGYERTQMAELDEKMHQVAVEGDAGGALHFPINKDNKDFLEAVNTIMEGMWIDGTIAKIYSDWGLTDPLFSRPPGPMPWISPSCNSFVHSQYFYDEEGNVN